MDMWRLIKDVSRKITMKKSSLLVFFKQLPGQVFLIALFFLAVSISSQGAKKYTQASGNWQTGGTWAGGVAPVAGDTVYILGAHTVSVTNNLYSNSTYMFLIVVGTLDLTNNGKLNFNASSKVIIESNGRILGNSNGDQISIGTGGGEYKGDAQGNITGPAYVGDDHSPVSGEGTAGCGCYNSVGSCTISSTDGYKVHISLMVKKLVKPATCVNGYNYNVTLDYAVSFSGTNIPGSLWTLQGNLTCGSQTLFFSLPTSGGVGSVTTGSNPWRAISDCSTATTFSLGCMTAETDVYGSGIPSGTKCSASPTTLPVKLLSFTGDQFEEGARLNWITSSEEEFGYFEIERAQEDLIFQSIAQIEGKGKLNARTSYTYTDAHARQGKNFYRLKSIDADESFEYSDIILVSYGSGGPEVSVYPTVIDQSNFTVSLRDEHFQSPVKLMLLNAVGTSVYQTDLISNSTLVQLPPSVKAGVYILKLVSASEQRLMRIVVN